MPETVEYCALEYNDIIKKLETNLVEGLTEQEHNKRLARDGHNGIVFNNRIARGGK